jgi:16S rRNA (cytosine967-C5)-methyltransferase
MNTAAVVLAEAARAVAAVEAGRSSEDALAAANTMPVRATIRAITLGTLRWHPRLAPLLPALVGRQRLTPLLRALLLAALHQLEYSRHPVEATVSSSVDAVRLLRQGRAAALTNAVLRRFLREREVLLAAVDARPAQRLAHPRWLLARLALDWPGEAEAIATANNEPAPMTLRVNRSRTTAEAYVAELAQAGHAAHTLAWQPTAVVLARPMAVTELPGFAEGTVSVQDAAAQLAAALLAPRAGERILDACAAPGGKTGALLESTANIELVAADIDAQRVAMIAETLTRLHCDAQLQQRDLAVDDGWEAAGFDAILLDAPCSSTGVIRRHPDIKLLRREADIEALAAVQRRLLTACWHRLRAGGRLVYSTCSVLQAENDAVLGEFLAATPDARSQPPAVQLPPGIRATAHGWQLLPGGEAGADGFYYACLAKT